MPWTISWNFKLPRDYQELASQRNDPRGSYTCTTVWKWRESSVLGYFCFHTRGDECLAYHTRKLVSNNVSNIITTCWKVKWSRYRPGVAQRVGRGIALLFHDRGTRRGWVVSSTPLPGKTRYPFYRKLAGFQGWSGRAENLVPTGIRSRTVQPVVSNNYILPYKNTIYVLTPWSRVLHEKITGLQLAKKFPAFHGTRRSSTALTSVRQLSLFRTSPIQSTCPHPTSWRSILILSTHLRPGLPSGLIPSGFPQQDPIHPPLLTHTRHMPSPYSIHNSHKTILLQIPGKLTARHTHEIYKAVQNIQFIKPHIISKLYLTCLFYFIVYILIYCINCWK